MNPNELTVLNDRCGDKGRHGALYKIHRTLREEMGRHGTRVKRRHGTRVKRRHGTRVKRTQDKGKGDTGKGQ